jgi:UDP-N-acetylmuramoylalanine--D-glutamate ligase
MRVTVVGLAETGIATANVLAGLGAAVTVSEARPEKAVAVALARLDPRVAAETGGHRPETFSGAGLVVPSPGVPRDHQGLAAAVAAGVPVQSEIEVAWRLIDRPMLAITGTNGKSTAVSLLGAMLAAGGRRAPVVGNIGTPLIAMAARDDYDFLVVEVSSFQLEWVDAFRPRVSAVLNVTDDHLDRYRDFADYRDTKLRIAARQGAADCLVINGDDPSLTGAGRGWPVRTVRFSSRPATDGLWLEGDLLRRSTPAGAETLLDTRELKLTGAHNRENVMAAAAMALDVGVPAEAVRRGAIGLSALPHRNELVGVVRGVSYYDDSKGTNVGAVVKSLEGFDAPVILIAGGREKGGSYAPLADPAGRKVKLLIVIGEARARMKAELGGVVRTVEAGSLEEAVGQAASAGVPGDVVLLSPACSSFDMFRDYHHRGQVFRDAVGRLA